ncbi:glycosyltransferase family 1 protein [Guptibacillus spartinae]|uniref:glycosyltransferase family 1 protein n=1 Tax=Guptibacillus spartinae TaxID=3025679 RepID=UPI002360F830|nr:glycosyltransferase family 1 protein [Pseudalkalibacillus spartinae]
MKEKLKILHVVGAMNRAGTETMLMNIYRNIDRTKVQFDFISYSNYESHYDKEIISLGGRVIKLSRTSSIKELYKVMKVNGPYQAIHSHTLFHCGIANAAALLAGVKIRVSHAHTTVDDSNSIIRKVYIKVMRVMIRSFSTHFLACSKGAGNYLFGEKLINNKRYAYFPNLIDYEPFLKEPRSKVASFKLQEGLGNNIVVGHVGRFIEAKNQLFLLKTLNELLIRNNNVRLLLVGDGDLKVEIQKQAEEMSLSDKICFTGIREDIPVMMHSMDAFVLPSHYEGLGLVLLEAQAAGLPCIVSEAIQPEADLNIGKMTSLSLEQSPAEWAEEILKAVGKQRLDSKQVEEGFKENNYTMQAGITRLSTLYKVDETGGGIYEESLNRFL